MRFRGFKTKCIFTLSIYVLVWHAQVVRWLREEFNIPVKGQATWRLFIPVYDWVVWWRYLKLIRQTEVSTIGAAEFSRGTKPLSVGRAFFWSGMWFAGGPYVNRHLNALDAFKRGQMAAAQFVPSPPPPAQLYGAGAALPPPPPPAAV
jgi:hypothetical protein